MFNLVFNCPPTDKQIYKDGNITRTWSKYFFEVFECIFHKFTHQPANCNLHFHCPDDGIVTHINNITKLTLKIITASEKISFISFKLPTSYTLVLTYETTYSNTCASEKWTHKIVNSSIFSINLGKNKNILKNLDYSNNFILGTTAQIWSWTNLSATNRLKCMLDIELIIQTTFS